MSYKTENVVAKNVNYSYNRKQEANGGVIC